MGNNELLKIQKYLVVQIERLNNDNLMKEQGMAEMQRSNALSKSVTTYLKTINTNMKVIQMTNDGIINNFKDLGL